MGNQVDDVDGPAAVLVRVGEGFHGQVSVDSCHIERSKMDDDTTVDRPSILLDIGWGTGDITVCQSTIHASAGGGVALVIGAGTTAARYAEPTVHFLDNTLTVSGAESSDCAIRYQAAGERWLRTQMLEIRGNTIENLNISGAGGFETGISVSIEPDGLGSQSVNKDNFRIVGNTIRDCTGDGIVLSSDLLDEDASAHMAAYAFHRNSVIGCGGAGIRLDRGDDLGGYLNAQMYGNLVADNEYGIVVQGVGINAPWALAGCTIANNTSVGIALDDFVNHRPESMVNCIVYDNNSGGDQLGSTSTGTPVSWDVTDIPGAVKHNNLQGYFTSSSCTPDANDNVDYVPGFVNAAAGDYHLLSTACSRNKGDNAPSVGPAPTELDIDGEPRVYRADTVNVIDQGADEYSGG